MDLSAPVSDFMSTSLKTVKAEDSLEQVKELFDEFNIHHVPVVEGTYILGMISKSDLKHFLHGVENNEADRILEETRLRAWKAKEIMTKKLFVVEKDDPVEKALELLYQNRFHAVPVMEHEKLVGIVTTFDIIEALLE